MHRIGGAQTASKQRQFVRWLKNSRIERTGIYRRLAQIAFVNWEGHKIYLALDSSSLWDEFVIVQVALVYSGRALPLNWVVLKQQSTMVAFDKYQHILKEAGAILPNGCPVILLADRASTVTICFVRRVTWAGAFASA